MTAPPSRAPVRAWTIAGLAIAALGLLAWWWPMEDAPPQHGAAPADVARDRAGGTANGGSAAPGSHRDERSAREPVATAGAEPASGEWTVQLTGIHAAVPWTAPLVFVFENQFQTVADVDARGLCRFVPPDGARLPGIQNLRIVARDDHYRIARSRQRTDSLQQTGFLEELAVHPIAQLRGRVLGPDGNGIVARVSAFAFGSEGPGGPPLARTDSGPDGSYVLRVPPATPLLLLAEVVVADAAAPWQQRPPSSVLLDLETLQSIDDLGVTDDRRASPAPSPAALRAEGTHAAPRTVADLRLGATATLTGRATFADGSPLTHGIVIATQAGATTAPWRGNLHWSPTDGVVSGAQTHTDERGAFALQLLPGAPFHVQATTEEPLLLGGEPSAIASAPGHVELMAPGDLVTLRVLAEGTPVPRAWLDVGDVAWRIADTGRQRVTLPPRSVRVRARADVRASAWVELPPGARPAVVNLDLVTPELADVQFVLRSEPWLHVATFAWQPLPDGAVMTTAGSRFRSDMPFALRVPPGRYRVTVRSEGASMGSYLLPLQLDVDVPPAGVTVAHDVSFGGQLMLDVLDTNGTRLTGTFALRDAGGRDVTPMTVAFDESGEARVTAVGELQPFAVNRLAAVLPPGDYGLTVEAPGRAPEQRTVTIRARATTTASLRLR